MKKMFIKIKKFLLQLIIGKGNYWYLSMILNDEALKHYNNLNDISNIIVLNATKIMLKTTLDLIHTLGCDIYHDELKKFNKESSNNEIKNIKK